MKDDPKIWRISRIRNEISKGYYTMEDVLNALPTREAFLVCVSFASGLNQDIVDSEIYRKLIEHYGGCPLAGFDWPFCVPLIPEEDAIE